MIKKTGKAIADYPRDENGRVTFTTIPEVMEIPNLLAIQLDSYAEFLQRDVPIDKRKDQGLEAVFRSVSRSRRRRGGSSSSTTATS